MFKGKVSLSNFVTKLAYFLYSQSIIHLIYINNSFAIAACQLWNELPFNIRTAKSITVFKKKQKQNKKTVKIHLMSGTFCKV